MNASLTDTLALVRARINAAMGKHTPPTRDSIAGLPAGTHGGKQRSCKPSNLAITLFVYARAATDRPPHTHRHSHASAQPCEPGLLHTHATQAAKPLRQRSRNSSFAARSRSSVAALHPPFSQLLRRAGTSRGCQALCLCPSLMGPTPGAGGQ